jgi:hypothetical protein
MQFAAKSRSFPFDKLRVRMTNLGRGRNVRRRAESKEK